MSDVEPEAEPVAEEAPAEVEAAAEPEPEAEVVEEAPAEMAEPLLVGHVVIQDNVSEPGVQHTHHINPSTGEAHLSTSA